MPQLLLLLISAMVQGPPATTDTAFHAVAYVEIMPSSKAAVASAFKQYREASRKEEGYVRAELFEQAGWPGHFVIIETWSSQNAFNAHGTGSATKEWRSKLDPIRLSDYDQRPYRTLVPASATTVTNNRSTYVISHVDIGGQGTNASELLKRLAEASRKEPGNLRFDVLQHAMRANHFTVIEAWQNDKALDAHAAAAHTRQYRDGIGPIAGSPLDQRIYKVAE
jgi:autoinducer 2-degrading protein